MLSLLLNEVQQLITYKFFSVFEDLVFHFVGMTAARNNPAAKPVSLRLAAQEDALGRPSAD